MEQDIKVGNAGDVKVDESVQSEAVSGALEMGPLEIQLTAKLDNRKLLDYLAKQVPGGLAHQGIVLLENALFPSAAAPQA